MDCFNKVPWSVVVALELLADFSKPLLASFLIYQVLFSQAYYNGAALALSGISSNCLIYSPNIFWCSWDIVSVCIPLGYPRCWPQYNYIQVGALRRGRGKSDVIVTSSRSEKLVNIWFTSFILVFACSNILTDIKHMRNTTFHAVFWSYTEI